MKKAKAIAGLGQYALNTAQSRAIVGGAIHRDIIIHDNGTREVWTYQYTDSNGNRMWDSNEQRVLLHYVFLSAVV